MGRDTPPYPTLFAKYAEALVGAYDDIVLPAASEAMDWEAELAVVIGAPARHVDASAAELAIAGYTVLNDVTARDWQYRTLQWLQGKTFEATTPIGPELVTADEAGSGLDLLCEVDGEVVQTANTGDLVFGATTTIAYMSNDPHPATRRRHRAGHPRGRGPRPQATPLPAARADAHHLDSRPRTVPERLCRREVITPR